MNKTHDNENVKKEPEKVKEEVKEEKRIKIEKLCHATSILNVRSGPSKNHKIIGVVTANSKVVCDPDDYNKAATGWQNGYVKVKANNGDEIYDGYCSVNYLR